MTLGEHITVLRKKKGFSQLKPSIEVVIKVADALEVSIDFMIGKTSLEIDNGTLKRLEELSKLPEEAKKQVFLVVDALIRDFKAKQAYS
jgi:transcriptional regulator with XRE-family HTH domain